MTAEMETIFQALTEHRYTMQSSNHLESLREEERESFVNFLNQIREEYYALDLSFAQQISSCSNSQQFIFTQQRWALQMKDSADLAKRLQAMQSAGDSEPDTKESVKREQLRLAVGEYIQSPNTGKCYLNLGEAAKTLQGFIYFSTEFEDSFIDRALSSNPPFPSFIATMAANPRLAIKYYHKKSCDSGVSLCGKKVKERATIEMKLTENIYKKALKMPIVSQALYSWLPAPHKNVIRCYEFWETEEHDAYYMVMEHADCGEMLNVIDHLHSVMNRPKLDLIDQLNAVQDEEERKRNVGAYNGVLALSPEGQSPHIETARFLFQQMVQAVATLHNQGVAHLDISLENFVVHFDDDGQLLVKIIDFGRAHKMKKKEIDDSGPNSWPYESFDFEVATPPGKFRYCSAASALFLKYKDAAPYDASQEDVYALAVCLYTMLTAKMPWDTPFYIERDANKADYGYLNGDKKHKIDLRTMTDAQSGLDIQPEIIDANFHRFQSAQGLMNAIQENCYLDYFSPNALHLLCQMFDSKMSLKELAVHPFASTPPNSQILEIVVEQYAQYKQSEYQKDLKHAETVAATLSYLDSNWLTMKAKMMIIGNRNQEPINVITSEGPSDHFIRDDSACELVLAHEESEKMNPESGWSDNSLDTTRSVSNIVNGSGRFGEMSPSPEMSPDPVDYPDIHPMSSMMERMKLNSYSG